MILENALSLSSVTGPTAHPTWILLRRCPSMRGTHCVALVWVAHTYFKMGGNISIRQSSTSKNRK